MHHHLNFCNSTSFFAQVYIHLRCVSYNFMGCVHMQSKDKKGSGHRILADHLDASRLENYLNTPERLSEDIVRCISSIYCKLPSVPQSNAGLSASPTSSLSSFSIFPSKNPCDSWRPNYYEDGSVHKLSKEERGPHTSMVEVLRIYLDEDSFNYAAEMLENFRWSTCTQLCYS